MNKMFFKKRKTDELRFSFLMSELEKEISHARNINKSKEVRIHYLNNLEFIIKEAKEELQKEL